MKKILFIVILNFFVFFNTGVYAKEIYYTNNYGVNFSLEEYDFISKMFYVGYQKIMMEEDYNNIFSEDIINSEIVSNTYISNGDIKPYGLSHSTASKKLTISKACTSNCLITINATWIKSPVVRSYDVIGAYLDGVTLLTEPTTTAINTSGSNSSTEIVKFENGFGVSVKLPNSGNDMKVSQYFKVINSGKVYASYQHAAKSISLANSKKYTISRSGYGGVFLFNSSVRDYYDGMGGVDITI